MDHVHKPKRQSVSEGLSLYAFNTSAARPRFGEQLTFGTATLSCNELIKGLARKSFRVAGSSHKRSSDTVAPIEIEILPGNHFVADRFGRIQPLRGKWQV